MTLWLLLFTNRTRSILFFRSGLNTARCSGRRSSPSAVQHRPETGQTVLPQPNQAQSFRMRTRFKSAHQSVILLFYLSSMFMVNVLFIVRI